jgi:SAM-dependent methyltransferase
VDLITNNTDGLGAAIHYRQKLPDLFPRFQTDADSMPFASAQFDCVIFNASFHYSEDYVATMAEAVRCLRNEGMVIIADTAWYSREESGEQMIAERQQMFNSRYGFPSNGLKSLEYLTDSRLDRLAQLFNLNWQIVTPYYGIRWALRPWVARLHGRREPSQFRIYFSEVRK